MFDDDDDICINLNNDDNDDIYNIYGKEETKSTNTLVTSNVKTIVKEKTQPVVTSKVAVKSKLVKDKNDDIDSNVSNSKSLSKNKKRVKHDNEIEKEIVEEEEEEEETLSLHVEPITTTKEVENQVIEKSNLKQPKIKWSEKEDPSLYHATPRFLSKDSKSISITEPQTNSSSSSSSSLSTSTKTNNTTTVINNYIFSRASFESLKLDKKLVEVLQAPTNENGVNLTTSTRVQSVAIPLLINQHNMLIKSQTGSGKTLAYLLPILHDIMSIQPQIQRSDGTRALILAPTRELCSQITDILMKLTQACVYIVGGLITGGEKRKSEKARLRKGVVILVSTPGRLLDHLKTTESFVVNQLKWIVLDEADRLLDMGKFYIFLYVYINTHILLLIPIPT